MWSVSLLMDIEYLQSYKCKVIADLGTGASIFGEDCKSQTASNEDEEGLSEMDDGFDLLVLGLLDPHGDDSRSVRWLAACVRGD